MSKGRDPNKTTPGLSPRTVAIIHNILKGALDQAVLVNLIHSNPAKATHLPRKERKEVQCLEAHEVKTFLAAIKDELLFPLIYTDLATGLRLGEITGLKWDCVNLEQRTITICRSYNQIKGKPVLQDDTKTDSSFAVVGISNRVVEILTNLKSQQSKNKADFGEAYMYQGFVFTWEDGRPFRQDYAYHKPQKLLKRHGLPVVKFHALRHTFCTLLLEDGMKLAKISKLARHKSYSTTANLYLHLTAAMREGAGDQIDSILSE